MKIMGSGSLTDRGNETQDALGERSKPKMNMD